MLDSIVTGTAVSPAVFIICIIAALVLGIGIAALGMYKCSCSQSFALTLALLPAIVDVIIMLVNGNVGTGVAVAGAFSLVRFRSVQGNARQICLIFLAMAVGLATGMGYVALAFICFALIGACFLLLTGLGFGSERSDERELKVTIPEGLDYDGIFDDLFAEYTGYAELIKVKTSNMGTLYELTYKIRLKKGVSSKKLLDGLRCRNGNLNIVCGKPVTRDEL